MIVIKSLEKTCYACSAQWEGWTNDNRQVYIRYRHGFLSVRISEEGDDTEYAAVEGEEVYGEWIGDSGYMSLDELKTHLDGKIIIQ